MIWSLIRPPSFTSHGKSGKPARAVLWLLLVGIPSSKIYHSEFAVVGRDAKRLVILKGDFESGEEKGGQLKEEIARKYSAYFQSILHHNNGYFLTVSAILTSTTHTLHWWKAKQYWLLLLTCCFPLLQLSEFPLPPNYPLMHQEPNEGHSDAAAIAALLISDLCNAQSLRFQIFSNKVISNNTFSPALKVVHFVSDQ